MFKLTYDILVSTKHKGVKMFDKLRDQVNKIESFDYSESKNGNSLRNLDIDELSNLIDDVESDFEKFKLKLMSIIEES